MVCNLRIVFDSRSTAVGFDWRYKQYWLSHGKENHVASLGAGTMLTALFGLQTGLYRISTQHPHMGLASFQANIDEGPRFMSLDRQECRLPAAAYLHVEGFCPGYQQGMGVPPSTSDNHQLLFQTSSSSRPRASGRIMR